MSSYDGWDADPEQPQQATAQDFAGMLKARAVSILSAAGHADCPMLDGARYEPASGAVVCGCGEFEPWSDDPDNPPWEPDADAADRAVQHAAQQRGGTVERVAEDPIKSTLALIDPSKIYTPEDVERHILDTLYRLETGQDFEREATVRQYETKQAYEIKYAACITTATGGAADVRKAQAMLSCQDEYTAMMEAEMVAKAVKATMHNLRAALTGYQSVAKSVAATYQAGGSQGAPPQAGRPPW